MATSFTARGAHTVNSMFFKPMLRKSIHKKSTPHDITRDAANTEAAEEVKHKGLSGDADGLVSWVPDERTGIYYPKGQEKVMQDVPFGAANDTQVVNWFS